MSAERPPNNGTPPESGDPAYVSDARLVQLRVNGLSFRGIAEEVGLAVSTVFQRLNHPEIRPQWEGRIAEALDAAGKAYERHMSDLVEMEILVALGVTPADKAQVQALNNALARGGMPTTRRIHHTGTLRHLSDEDIDREEAKLERVLTGGSGPLG